jgi:hypothetical protein
MEGYRSRGILRLHPVERGPRQPIDDRRLAQALEMFNKGEGGFKEVIFMSGAQTPQTAS